MQPNSQSRAHAVSYDGSVITGFDVLRPFDFLRRGVYWSGGVEHFLSSNPQTVDNTYFNEGNHISRDGEIIFGDQRVDPDAGCVNSRCAAYLYYVPTGEAESIGALPAGASFAYRGSDDGSVVLGWDSSEFGRTATVWTRQLGWTSLTQFLNAQGTYAQGIDLGNGTAISADGRVWGAFGGQISGISPIRYDVPKAIVCHKAPGSPNATPENLDVEFPGGLDEHLAHGDTFGLCQIGVP